MENSFFKENKKGIIGTVIFHLALIIILLISGFSTPLPLPAEEGILINFGTEETGFGNNEPEYNQPTEEKETLPEAQEEVKTPESQPETEQVEEEYLEQDFEESATLEENKKEKTEPTEKETEEKTEPEKIKEPVEEQLEEQEEIAEEKQEEVKREVDKRALFPGKNEQNETQNNEGITEGEGNQGNETGETESDNYTDAESTGGNGISYNLAGRNPVSLPKPEYSPQDEGYVVVEVYVNRRGEVISAIPGKKGTTTSNSRLWNAAKKAALDAKFDVATDPGTPERQRGTITYHFVLQ